MDTVTLLYNATTLPALLDRNAEGFTSNWTSGGTQTISTSTDYAHSGAQSFKLVSAGFGDFTTNYAGLPALDSQTVAVGTQYAITLWVLQPTGAPISFMIQTNGVQTSPSQFLTIPDGSWHPITWVFTAASANTELKIQVSAAYTVYIDDITVTQATQLNILSMKGLDDPDSYSFFPAIRNDYLDGSIDTQFQAFRRVVTIDCGVVQARADRLGILSFWMDNSRMINYTSSSASEAQLPFVPKDASGYSNTWEQNTKLGRRFVLNLDEPSTRTTFPV